MTTLQRVKSTIEAHGLIGRDDSLLVGLSGGPDSVALLHLLTRLRAGLDLRLEAVYVNHQIRPRAAKAEEKFCHKLCRELGVEFSIVRHDIPKLAETEKKSLEEAARDFRYASFDYLAEENACNKIALGHHADDQVETILFRLFRGTGPSGLTGMPIKRGRIIRPLLELTKGEILLYLKKHRLEYRVDSSNKSSRHSRNLIRNRLLPMVRERLSPAADRAVLSLAEIVRDEDNFLAVQVDRAARKALEITPGGKFNLDSGIFCDYDGWVRRRLLRRCLKGSCPSGQYPDRDTVDRVDRLAETGEGALSLPGQIQAWAGSGRLLVYRRRSSEVRQPLFVGKLLRLNWPALQIKATPARTGQVRIKRQARANRVYLDLDQVKPPLVVRTIKPGDQFRPLGMRGHKKVGDFLTDLKLPRPLRDEVILLCDSQRVIWVIGFEIADQVKVTDQTRKVLSVAVSVRKKTDQAAV